MVYNDFKLKFEVVCDQIIIPNQFFDGQIKFSSIFFIFGHFC